MKRVLMAAAFLVLAATPALAARCPHGQLLRVRLGKCVSLSSPLALAYVGPLHRSRIRDATFRHVVRIYSPDPAPAPAADPPDPPPTFVDQAAWALLPLLRAVEARWTVIVAPPVLHQPSQAPNPAPWLSLPCCGPTQEWPQ